MASEGKQSRREARRLNDLSGSEWVKATKSWFICDGRPRSVTPEVRDHPATYPPEVPQHFIRLFTRDGATVLDPFVGTGSTLLACLELGRRGVGVELNEEYCEVARDRLARADAVLSKGRPPQEVICADASELRALGIEPIDYCITSPPYWDMLRRSRGQARSEHKNRAEAGLDLSYSDDTHDLGNIEGYEAYVEALANVFEQVAELLKPGKYATVIVQNIRTAEGTMAPLAWDIARRVGEVLQLVQETVWCQDKKRLGCWGYPTTFVSNVHHHYCLTFRKPRDD